MRESKRTQRISELIQRELADIIHREVNDTHLGLLTIADVEVSADLECAHVYVTALESRLTIAQIEQHLNGLANLLRYRLSQRLTIRTTPRLLFVYDESIEYGIHLSALIDSVVSPTNSSEDPSTD